MGRSATSIRKSLPHRAHAAENAGIARVVDGEPVRHLDDVAGRGAGITGVIGLGHGDAGAFEGDGAAHIEARPSENLAGRDAFFLQSAGRADNGSEFGVGLFADVNAVAGVITVVMGDQHEVHAVLDDFRLEGRNREIGIYENADVVVAETEGRMSVPGNGAHA